MRIFVYGTLLKGNRNHDSYLSNCKFLGKAVLHGYTMYDICSFPGIKKSSSNYVFGEIYEVNKCVLAKLHQLEGEGSLYKLVTEPVETNGKFLYDVGVYVYLHDVCLQNIVKHEDQPWRG